MKSSAISVLAMLMLTGCASFPVAQVAQGDFPVTGVEMHRFKRGDATHGEFGVRFGGVARDNFVRIVGQWSDPSFQKHELTGRYYGSAAHRRWSIEVHPEPTTAQREAIEHAKDGYAADLGYAINAGARIYPRFERKTFEWGQGVTFLVQYQNDNTNYVPNNGMLTYEVHGITQNGRYIRASFGVTHPSLVEFGPGVRDHRDGDPADPKSSMRRDPHYRLAETAAPSSFEPSLTEIDRFLTNLHTK